MLKQVKFKINGLMKKKITYPTKSTHCYIIMNTLYILLQDLYARNYIKAQPLPSLELSRNSSKSPPLL